MADLGLSVADGCVFLRLSRRLSDRSLLATGGGNVAAPARGEIRPRGDIDALVQLFTEDGAFVIKTVEGETRVVLRLHPRLAPVTVGVFPLVKKDGMPEKAHEIEEELRELGLTTFYDEKAAIGRRYRRQDEIGTPWCVTIDFDTIEKPGDTFTLRDRDSMSQKRITEAELFALLEEQVY